MSKDFKSVNQVLSLWSRRSLRICPTSAQNLESLPAQPAEQKSLDLRAHINDEGEKGGERERGEKPTTHKCTDKKTSVHFSDRKVRAAMFLKCFIKNKKKANHLPLVIIRRNTALGAMFISH